MSNFTSKTLNAELMDVGNALKRIHERMPNPSGKPGDRSYVGKGERLGVRIYK